MTHTTDNTNPSLCIRYRGAAAQVGLVVASMLVFGGRIVFGQTVLINEFLAANDTTIIDPHFGEYADWVELYNPGASAIALDGWFLTDDVADSRKWQISGGVTIQAGGYIVFWADGQDVRYHPSFRLAAGGESIALFDSAGNPVDVINFGVQTNDVSFGRAPDGSTELRFFENPTPGRANVSGGYLGVAEPADFSAPAGFYPAATAIELTSNLDGAQIRYTVDGTPPDLASAVYTQALTISSTTVLRAAVFKDGFLPSSISTNTYFVGESPSLPVVSLSTDPANFFDDEVGIYVEGTNGIPGFCRSTPFNWNQDWERPIHIELFEPDGAPAFSIDAGVKLHGGCTRIYPQKSLAIFARKKYGTGRIDYPIFGPTGHPSYNNLVLRSSAQDWWRTMFRDGMIHTVIDSGMELETQAYRPAVVFLNGEYWGIHNMREKQNEHYLADRFGIDRAAVEILEGNKADVIGQSAHYDAMMSFMLSADMSRPETLDAIGAWMDVDAYIDYLIAEIYSANGDWPGNNLKFWRPTVEGGRWRWMILDMDFGFGGNANGLSHSNTLALATEPNGPEWPNPPWSTLLFRTLLENTAFANEFIQRFASHMNTTFEAERVLATIDSLKGIIAAEIPRHKQRWPESISFGSSWEELIDNMRVFARNRAGNARLHFYDHFGLPGSSRVTVSIDDPDGGGVLAHGVPLPGPIFSGGFFRDVPLALIAVPAPGYRFLGWTGDLVSPDDTASVVLSGDISLTARFTHDGAGTANEPVVSYQDRLTGNYPNPFSSVTRLEFEVASPGPVGVRLVDILGREVAVLADKMMSAGLHRVIIDGAKLSPGVYVAVMTSARGSHSRTVMIIR